MRKFFALALAVAMVLSLASVSFAIDAPAIEGDIVISNFYKYSGDSDKLDTDAQAQYGKSYYAVIYQLVGEYDLAVAAPANELNAGDTYTLAYEPISDYDQVEKLKVKAEFEMGEDLVESVSIVKKNITTIAGTHFTLAEAGTREAEEHTYNGTTWDVTDVDDYTVGDAPNGFVYCVEIKTKAERVTGDADIIGTLEFNRKAKAKENILKIDEVEIDFALNLFYEKGYINASGPVAAYEVKDSIPLKWDDLYALKFDSDDEVEIEFGYEDLNEGLFTVDASGQGKIVIDFNTKANEAIADANPGVKMHFINFNGAKFNRTGVFEYEMENMVAAYKVEGDKLVEIPGLELDSEVATFSTRTLGNYVFADAELVNPVAEAPVVEAPAAVTNPSTGF